VRPKNEKQTEHYNNQPTSKSKHNKQLEPNDSNSKSIRFNLLLVNPKPPLIHTSFIFPFSQLLLLLLLLLFSLLLFGCYYSSVERSACPINVGDNKNFVVDRGRKGGVWSRGPGDVSKISNVFTYEIGCSTEDEV